MSFNFVKMAVVAAVTAVIASASVAIAQNSGGGNGGGGPDNGRQGQRGGDRSDGPRGGRPPDLLRNLTYAELHKFANGKAVVVRIDRGKIKSVGADSVTLTAIDGSEVTIEVDGETEIRMPRTPDAELSDLKAGQDVVVHRTAGKPAKTIGVLPRRRAGDRGRGGPGGGEPGPGESGGGESGAGDRP